MNFLIAKVNAALKMQQELKMELFKFIIERMKHAEKNEYTLDKFDEDEDALEGIDFRNAGRFGEDKSFYANGDERNDTIAGIVWEEETGIPVLVTQNVEHELQAITHPMDDGLSLKDLKTIAELVDKWVDEAC